MRAYETVYVLDASLDPEAVDAKLDAFHSVLGGEVSVLDHWGVRQLAYPVGKERTAYYAVAQFSAETTALPEFERLLKLDEQVLRHLTVLNEGQPTSGASVLARRPIPSGDDAGYPEGDAPGEGNAQEDGNTRATADGAAPLPDDHDPASEAEAADPPETPNPDAPEAAPEAAVAEGESAPDESASDESAGDEPAAAPPRPRSGPPEFAGTRGRRRRHEGPPIVLLNYKDVATLSRFLTEQGKILPKRTTKVTAAFQRQLGTAVKRARFLALLPYTKDHLA